MSYQLTADDGIAIFRMDNGTANALTPAVMEDWASVFSDLGSDDTVRGCVIAGNHRMFSAGLDLSTIAGLDAVGIERTLTALVDLTMALYGFHKPLVAAVTGHAIAGGAILSLAADLRVGQAGKARWGLNEIELALPLPAMVIEMLRAQAGDRVAWQVAREGRLMSLQTAHELGLVEYVVEHCLERAMSEARFLANKDPAAYRVTKGYVRSPVLARMAATMEASRADFTDAFVGPASERIQEAVVKLGKR